MRFAVLGAGALGSLFGARLAAAGHPVTLLARADDHVDAVRERGLTLRTPYGSERTVTPAATTDPDAVTPPDCVLVCVKAHQTTAAMRGVAGTRLLAADPAILSLQNGLGNARTLTNHVPADAVLTGVTAHGATRPEPGVVDHAGTGPTHIGRFEGPTDARTRDVASALSDAVEVTVVEDVRDRVWEKAVVNVAVNATTALADVPNGALVDGDPADRLIRRAVAEAAAVGRAEGRDLPPDARLVERVREVAAATASNRSSMLSDLDAGRRTEVEALHGAVVERAARHALAVPVLETLADLVRLAQPSSEGAGGRGQP